MLKHQPFASHVCKSTIFLSLTGLTIKVNRGKEEPIDLFIPLLFSDCRVIDFRTARRWLVPLEGLSALKKY